MGDDFFKGFESFVKNMGINSNVPVSEEEVAKAEQMFKEMFKQHDDAAHENEDDNNQVNLNTSLYFKKFHPQ